MSGLEVNSECTTIVKWKLANFSTVASRDDPNKALLSDYFQLDSSDIKCRLQFEPTNTHDNGDKNYSSVYLHVTDSNIKLRLKFWIENELGDKTPDALEIEHVFDNPTLGWGYPEFVHHDILYSPNGDFIKNDTVLLCCRIVRGGAFKILSTFFHANLWKSYKEGLVGECTLKISDKEFKVSKTVLTAHSDVFKRMLESNMKEGSTDQIEIKDFDVKTIEALIEYLHFESVDRLSGVALELFKLADVYNINRLKSQCEESLIKTINNDNYCDRLILAFMHNSESLKLAVLNYIADSKDKLFTSMMKSTDWIQFSSKNERLSLDIISAVLEKLDIKH